MERIKAKAALEAILFTMGESVGIDALAAAIEESETSATELLEELERDYEAEGRGLRILALEDRYQMTTRKEYYENLIKVATRPKKRSLSEAALEVLSIVAYRQPVTRLEIEKIRGVSCDYVINRLLEFELIEECGRLNAPGRPIQFGTTENFLRNFGLNSIDNLPSLNTEEVEMFREEAEEEISLRLPKKEEDGKTESGNEVEDSSLEEEGEPIEET